MDALATIFTGVIAIATMVYAWFAVRLWQATRMQAEIARYATFAALLQTLASETEKQKVADPKSATLLEAFLNLIAEFGFKRLLEDLDLEADPSARDYFLRIEGMLRGQGIDPAKVPWMKPIMEQLEE